MNYKKMQSVFKNKMLVKCRIRKHLLLSTAVLILFQFTSCRKYLDKPSSNMLTTPSSLSALQALLDNSGQMNLNVTPAFGEASADDYFLLYDTYNTRTDVQKSIYVWNTIDYYFENDWSLGYLTVYNSNLCLEGLEKIPINQENEQLWKSIRGSALFHRAYSFLNLLWVYSKAYDVNTAEGDLGIDLRLTSDFNIPSKRFSVQESYERVLVDAKQALENLPDVSQHVFRPSKAAAYGLLARAYLSMRQYDSAFRYANLTLGLRNDLLNYNNVVTSSSLPFSQTSYNGEAIFYSTMTTIFSFPIINPSRGKIDSALYSSYSSNDLRKEAFFQPNSGYFQFKGAYSTNGAFFSGIATDEMFLIRAECYARFGNKDAALTDLNTLLIKRWKNNGTWSNITASTASETLERVLVERRKELVMRGLRWSDIKRLNKEGRNITLTRFISGQGYTLSPNDNRYALPLPTDIIQMTGMSQNPR